MKIRTLNGLIAASLALAPLVALGEDQPDKTAEAKSRYEAGKEHFQQGRYDEAMQAFTESYNLSGEPNLLYNLGATAERLGEGERAIAYYELYIEMLPDAPDADEIRARIEKLKTSPPTPAPQPAEQQASPEEPPAQEPAAEPAPSAEEYYKLNEDEDKVKVFWPGLVIGVGGLLLAGGTVTGIVAYKKYDELETTCSPNCTDSETDTTRNLALATDLQFAFGAVAVVAGTVMWIVHAKKKEPDSSVQMTASPAAVTGGGGLVVVGSF